MPVQWLCHAYPDVWMGSGSGSDEFRQVALEVDTGREEVRDDHNLLHTFSGQTRDCPQQVRLSNLQKRGLDLRISSVAGEVGCRTAYRLIRGLDAGSMGENDDTGIPGSRKGHACSQDSVAGLAAPQFVG